MLVLSRRKDEKIVIGEDIEITVVEVKGDTVKLGISAPGNVKIFRKELFDIIAKANIEAADQKVIDLDEVAKKLKGRYKTEK